MKTCVLITAAALAIAAATANAEQTAGEGLGTVHFPISCTAMQARFERAVAELAGLARDRGAGSDQTVRQKVAQAQIEAHVFRLIGLRNLTMVEDHLPHGANGDHARSLQPVVGHCIQVE